MQPITPTNATCLLVKLSQYCLINITGPDAIKFLQGQVTCDLRELSSPVIRLGAQCNPKGRIIFSFNALQESTDSIFLRIPKTMQTNAIQSLKKYIVFSKAKVNATEDQYYLYGILGKSAAEAINHFFRFLPNGIN